MNAKNCEELLSKKDVDGGLIGGASLKAPDFAVIVNAATKADRRFKSAVSAPGCAAFPALCRALIC